MHFFCAPARVPVFGGGGGGGGGGGNVCVCVCVSRNTVIMFILFFDRSNYFALVKRSLLILIYIYTAIQITSIIIIIIIIVNNNEWQFVKRLQSNESAEQTL